MPEEALPIIEHEAALLASFPPFDRMDAARLGAILADSRLRFYPRGGQILHPSVGVARREMFVVRQGSVSRTDIETAPVPGGEGVVIGPGGLFPPEAALDEAPAHAYAAREDCFCWAVSGDAASRLLQDPAVLAWLLARSSEEARGLRRRYAEDAEAGHIAAEVLCLPVSAILSRGALSLTEEGSVREATELMARERVGSVVIVSDQRPVGILTESDILRRVVAAGGETSSPVSTAMTASPFVLAKSATVAEAALEMTTRSIRHIPVVEDDGTLAGVISARDLFRLQRQGFAHLAAPIERAESVEELAAAVAAFRETGRAIFLHGMSAESLTMLMSSLNDRVTQRVLEVVRRDGDPEGGFCWLAFGSEGRHEQTFSTDQDNGIIFTGDSSERERFLDYAERVNAALDLCGFPLCKGGVMAKNPQWCLTLPEWKERFGSWIRTPTPEALLFANIFFDFRPLLGDASLAEALRDHLFVLSRDNTIFLQMMASNALNTTPPLGTFSRFSTDGGEHGGTIDLKKRGAVMFVDAARIFALAQGVRATNTGERLRLGGKRLKRNAAAIEADVSAFHFVQALRIRAQLGVGAGAGDDPNRIDPYALNELDQRILRESLRQAQHLQERLKLDYRL